MVSKNKHDTYHTLFHWKSLRFRLVYEGIAVGIFASIIVILYRFVLSESMILLTKIYDFLSVHLHFIPILLLLFTLIAYVIGMLLKKEPMISGSGIPQVEGVLLKKLHMNWIQVLIGKFIGGVLAIGSGLSLGREGPSVQLGAAAGQGVSRVFKRSNVEEKYLITSGASAGLAAAFNAPLAGVLFALEEVHKNFSPYVLLSSLAAALTADYISRGFFGLKPILNFKQLSLLPLDSYILIIILGIIIGVFGVLFNLLLLKTQRAYTKLKLLPKEYRIIIPLFLSLLIGLYLPQVLGGGHDLIMNSLLNWNQPIKILMVVLIVKFIFTMICYGSGAPGGIFLPLLAIGALIGNLYGLFLVHFMNFDPMYINSFIILAMAGYFTAIVRAPITGIILITEMTGSFSHLLSISLVSITAYVVAEVLGSKPIYESLLERFLESGGSVQTNDAKHKMLLEFAVCMGSNFDGKKLKEIKLPDHCLLVSIRRGEDEIIPKGDTQICAGDYLIVLANDNMVSKINDVFHELVDAS